VNEPTIEIDIPRLERSLRNVRTLSSAVRTGLTGFLSILAMFPLFSVLYMLIVRGGSQLRWSIFTELPPGAGMPGGGIGNAIVGTLVMLGVAIVVSVPLGTLAAVYLAEFSERSRIAVYVRFAGKVMTGLPSIIAGVFSYVLVVQTLGRFSAIAGGFALGVLMIPIVMLTAEEALKLVPSKMRQAAYGMGATKTQVTLRVVVPTALPAMLTGVMLSIARAMGETAPLLFTALFSYYWFHGAGDLTQPVSSLAVLIYNFASSPYANQVDLAWAASLVLVLIVLVVNVVAQWLIRSPYRA
jgi:phosphate transport system permease protein